MSDAGAALVRFAGVLRKAGLDPTATELAEVLWLASQMPAGAARANTGVAGARHVVQGAADGEGVPGEVAGAEAAAGAEEREPAAGLYLEGGAASSGAGAPMRSPTGAALPGALTLGRAMRPLKRWAPSRVGIQLDEAGTADRIAIATRPAVVVQPVIDRWLDLALVVEASASMVIWEQTVCDLRALLERLGAFRTIAVHRLMTEDGAALRVCRGTGAPGTSEGALFDPRGKRMVLVVSDCVARAWDDGRAGALLERWGRRAPVAILQVLPERLWRRTGLGAAEVVRLRSPEAGAVGRRLRVERLSPGFWGAGAVGEAGGVAVPVIDLAARSAAAWARMVAGGGEASATGLLVVTSAGDSGAAGRAETAEAATAEEERALTGDERVAQFRRTATAPARKLATLFAAAPLSLPVMRLIRETMLPVATVGHMAEVFLGGLMREVEAGKSGAEYVRYEFLEGVRERLLNSADRDEAAGVLGQVSEYVAAHFGSAVDFRAWVADPASIRRVGSVPAADQPFAAIGASVLKRMGGEYARLGQRLTRRLRKNEEVLHTRRASAERHDYSQPTATIPAPSSGQPTQDITTAPLAMRALCAQIEEALLEAPLLAKALAKRFRWDDDVRMEDRATQLVGESAKDLAMAFADAVEMLESDRDRRVAAGLLWRLLPLAADLQDMVAKARAAARDRVALELRLRTQTVAEIIMAGVDATYCVWAPDEHMPQGARHVPLPAAAHALLFDPKRERLEEAVQAVVTNLYEDPKPGEPRLPTHVLWGQVKKRFPRFRDFQTAAAAEMARGARSGEPYYMLVIDEDLDPRDERARDDAWRVVQESIGRALPHLRLVRLTGGADDLREEYSLALPIREVLGRK